MSPYRTRGVRQVVPPNHHDRLSNKDPAKSGSESKRIFNEEGGVSYCIVEFLSATFSELDSMDLGLWYLGTV